MDAASPPPPPPPPPLHLPEDYWSKMPKEVRLNCYENLGFFDRYRLRDVTRVDRNVISMLGKFKIAKINIEDISYGTIIEVEVNANERYKIIAENVEKREQQLIPFLAYLLKDGEIEEFVSKETAAFNAREIDMLHESAPYKIASMEIKNILTPQKLLYMQNRLYETKKLQPFQKLTIHNHNNIVALITRKWLLEDAEVGRVLEIGSHAKTTNFINFLRVVAGRRINTENAEIRIRTGNPQKHLVFFEGGSVRGFREMFLLLTVPSTLGNTLEDYRNFLREASGQ